MNVSEELVNNYDLLNWTIDRTNNSSPVSILSYEVVERLYGRQRRYLQQQRLIINISPNVNVSLSRQVVMEDILNESLRTHYETYYDSHINRNSKFNISIVLEEAKEGEGDFDCPICFELTIAESKITLNCGHTFCGQCIKKTLTSCNQNPTCALCRANVSCFKMSNKETHDLVGPHCNNVV
jgi:hypothetical protein